VPLYTYIVTFKGSVHIAQGSHRNFTGFISTWASGISEGTFSTMTPVQRKELTNRAYEGKFEIVSGVSHVWRKSINIGGSDCVVVAVQTDR